MRTLLCSLAALPLLSLASPTLAADAPAPAAASDRGHIDAAVTFLKALAHTNHKGAQAAEAWTELHTVAGDKVPVTIAGAHHDLDIAGKSIDAKLVNFSKIATLRDGPASTGIKGVTVGMLEFKVGADDHKGAGKIFMTQADGKWTVTSVEVE